MTAESGKPVYRWACAACRKTGPWVGGYGSAERSAGEHTRSFKHSTFVVDHYNMRVVGSTQDPGGQAAGDEEITRW